MLRQSVTAPTCLDRTLEAGHVKDAGNAGLNPKGFILEVFLIPAVLGILVVVEGDAVDSAVVDVVAGVVEVAKTITKLVKSMVTIMMFTDVLLQ